MEFIRARISNAPGQQQHPAGLHINRQQLGITEEEVDIGAAMVGSLKPAVQCRRAARTAQTVLDQLARGIHNRSKNIFLRLYQQYVRPHLKSVSPAWSPWQEGDKECLGKFREGSWA
jgi:hypothetical protein